MAISSLFVDRFGHSLRFCHRFDKEAISDGCRSENARFRGEVLNLSDLDFCGPCGPYL